MKKFLALIAILLVILAALLEFVLPRTVESILESQIVNSTSATAVDVSLSAKPNLKIAFGDIEKVHATAAAARIGDINFKNLNLDGDKISLDVQELLFPSKDLTANERTQKILQRAGKIELRGIVTEEELKNFIAIKGDNNLENAQVTIKPEAASATAKVKIFGRKVDLDVAGTFLVNNGDIYFHMTRLNTNSILSRVNIDSFMTDIKILDSGNLPLNLKFESVELRDGEAVVTAISTVK